MKKTGLLLTIVLCGLMKVYAQAAPKDTLKFAENRNEISTFLSLVHIAGLDSIYTGQRITIFAPDNKAFEKLPAGMLDSLSQPGNRQKLIALLNGHILLEGLLAKDLVMRIHKSYLIRGNTGSALFNTTYGSCISAKINGNRNIVLTDENGDESIVKQFDINDGNAVIFVISSVILPKK